MEQIKADSDRDCRLMVEQALKYGFIDHVYERVSQVDLETPGK